MLNHQIEFSKAIEEIYKPISGRVSDPDSYISEGNPEGIRACEEYRNIVHELLDSLKPELEMIETRILAPAKELLEIITQVQKTTVKRNHKQLDYDRHRSALKKLEDKKEKTLKDEKALFKIENEVEQSTQEFNYYNDLLKEELPQLFRLEREFVQPLFQSFYYMQLNVFYTLHEKMQNINIGYFDLSSDIEEAFANKKGEIQADAEKLAIVHFKTHGGRKPGQKYNPRLAIDNKPANKPANRASIARIEAPPPSYSEPSSSALAQRPVSYDSKTSLSSPPPASSSNSALILAAKKKKPAPAPPKPKPKPQFLASEKIAVEKATALYDYDATQDGDLSFRAGDEIEILTRTDDTNAWWSGKLRGAEGNFPGMWIYVEPSATQWLTCDRQLC
jgi:amphiphysin